jgi:hypothetical protein
MGVAVTTARGGVARSLHTVKPLIEQMQEVAGEDAAVAAEEAKSSSGLMNKLVDFFVGDAPGFSFSVKCGSCNGYHGLIPKSEVPTFRT